MRRHHLGLGLVASLAIAGHVAPFGRGGVPEARADEPAQIAVTGPGCKVKGTAPLTKGMQLFDAITGGRAIASFTGALVPMTLSEIPTDPKAARARLTTTDGTPALRLDGYVSASDLPLYTGRDIPVVSSHVWISSAQKVKLAAATGDGLRVELTIAGAQGQVARATAPCDAFTLQRGTPTRMDIDGHARGYMMKKSSIDLYEAPNGDAIYTLSMMEGTAQLFWSTEARAGFVHVMSRGDITIDAWARWRDLEALKKGEMMDQYIPPTTAFAGVQLALEKPPPIVKATKDIPVRARRDDKEKPIGAIETGAEIYVMETVAGWTNVLPKTLGMTPPDDGGFWIPAAEAPK